MASDRWGHRLEELLAVGRWDALSIVLIYKKVVGLVVGPVEMLVETFYTT